MASYGDWQFMIGVIKSSYFDNKEHFDNAYAPQSARSVDEFMCKSAEKISFQNDLKMINVDISCNMDYYLKHPNEIEKDLDRSVDFDLELKKENLKKI